MTASIVSLRPKRYRLGSAAFVHAPGLVSWAINAAKFENDQPAMIHVVASTWDIPESAARALLLEEVPHTIEDDAVVFTA